MISKLYFQFCHRVQFIISLQVGESSYSSFIFMSFSHALLASCCCGDEYSHSQKLFFSEQYFMRCRSLSP